MTIQPRQPAGIPTGGEFAETTRREADVNLEDEYEQEPAWEPPTTIHMPASRLGEAYERIEKANKRLARAGVEDRFTLTVTEYVHTSQDGVHTQMVAVELNEPELSFGGWSFTGAYDFTPDGSVISAHRKDGAPEVTEPRCDHCGSNRRRDRVYTLHNDEEGDKQVGKTCLAAFLGIRPAGLWALGYDMDLDDLDYDPDGSERDYHGGQSQVFPATDLIAAALAASANGSEFVPRSRGTVKQPSTVETVLKEWDTLHATATAKNQATAKKVLNWLKKQDGDNDYIRNLQAALIGKEKWVKRKHVAIAVSAIGAWRNDMDRDREKKIREERKATQKKEFLASPGEKLADVTATVKMVRQFEGNFGYHPTTQTMLVMIADSGHVVKWTTSSSVRFEEGARVTIEKATVKANDVYRGSGDEEWQTVVLRAKLKPAD